jgi:hypothetical protein
MYYTDFNIQPEDEIVVRIFDVNYYRESDMKKYTNKAIFFIEKGRVYSYSQALKFAPLKDPIEKLDDFITRSKLLNSSSKMREKNLQKNDLITR